MIILAIVATIAALIGTAVVVVANGMSDAPQQDFQGTGIIVAAWCVVAVFWFAWFVG